MNVCLFNVVAWSSGITSLSQFGACAHLSLHHVGGEPTEEHVYQDEARHAKQAACAARGCRYRSRLVSAWSRLLSLHLPIFPSSAPIYKAPGFSLRTALHSFNNPFSTLFSLFSRLHHACCIIRGRGRFARSSPGLGRGRYQVDPESHFRQRRQKRT